MSSTPHDLHLHVCTDKDDLGTRAGSHAADILREVLSTAPRARVMLAAAPSQLATLRAVVNAPQIDPSRLDLFHMDDYVGLAPDAPQGFGNWLHRHVVDPWGDEPQFHRIPTQTSDPAEAARTYAEVMGTAPFDLVLLGLGVNAHLAFNDPPADFDAPESASVVALDAVSRQQQTDEGHFASFEDVPTHAVTVTIPRLLNTTHLIASVPGAVKRQAVTDTVTSPPTPQVPGTALKFHPDAHLYVDQESGADVR